MGNKNFREMNISLKNKNQEYLMNHYYTLNILIKDSKLRCDQIKNFISSPKDMNNQLQNFLDPNSQVEIECSIKKALKYLEKSQDGLRIGDKKLQQIFTPISKLSSGDFGLALSTGFKGSNPFAIMKVSIGNKEEYQSNFNLHEIVIGLILNQIRYDTPCFSYCYGGFYCSPPLDLTKRWKVLEENLYYKLRDTFFKFQYSLDNLVYEKENQVYHLVSEKSDQIDEKFKKMVTGKIGFNLFFDDYLSYLNFLLEIIQDYEIKGMIRDKLITIIKVDKKEIQEMIDETKYFYPIIEEDKFCQSTNQDEISALSLFEFIPDAENLIYFLSNNQISDNQKLNVLLLLYSSLYIAYKKFKFLHNDLHPGNILVRKLNEEKEIKVKIDNNKEINIKTSFLPQVIDYGLSVVEYKNVILNSLESGKKYNEITFEDFLKNFEKLKLELGVFLEGYSFPNELDKLSINLDDWINEIYILYKKNN
jgi:hypothetical protein